MTRPDPSPGRRPSLRPLRLASISVVFASGPAAGGGEPVSANGSAAAQIIAPITIAREADLDFGTLAVASDSAGTVTIAPLTGGIRYTGGVSGICAAACPPPHPARFSVKGEPGRTYAVSVPTALSILPAGGTGGQPVTVDTLTVGTVSNPGDPGGVLSATGVDGFEIGGTLHLPANAPAGRYSSQVPVVVSYP